MHDKILLRFEIREHLLRSGTTFVNLEFPQFQYNWRQIIKERFR